jgi:hypothetical protein
MSVNAATPTSAPADPLRPGAARTWRVGLTAAAVALGRATTATRSTAAAGA